MTTLFSINSTKAVPVSPGVELPAAINPVVDSGNQAGGTGVDTAAHTLGHGDDIALINIPGGDLVHSALGSPVAVNIFRADDSSSNDFAQVGIGSDPDSSPIDADILSAHNSTGGGMVDTEIFQRSDDTSLSFDLLGPGSASSGLIDADVQNPGWTHNALVDAEIGSGLGGLDNLTGEVPFESPITDLSHMGLLLA